MGKLMPCHYLTVKKMRLVLPAVIRWQAVLETTAEAGGTVSVLRQIYLFAGQRRDLVRLSLGRVDTCLLLSFSAMSQMLACHIFAS